MQRGILTLTKSELETLMSVFDITKYEGMHLSNKLKAGSESGIDPVDLELSEDELEVISDEVAAPSLNEPESMKLVRSKITQLMMKFRNRIVEG